MRLHQGSWECGGWGSAPFHLYVSVPKSLVKHSSLVHDRDVIQETLEETPSAASGETWERILFPGFLCVVSWMQEIPDGTPGEECYRAVTGLLFAIYTHSLGDLIQFYSFIYLLSTTPTFISSPALSSTFQMLPFKHPPNTLCNLHPKTYSTCSIPHFKLMVTPFPRCSGQALQHYFGSYLTHNF